MPYFYLLGQRICVNSKIRLEVGKMNLNFLANYICAGVYRLVTTALDRGRVMWGTEH